MITAQNYPHLSKGQITALTGALLLHGMIAAWAIMPSRLSLPPQQVMRVSLVAPSSLAAIQNPQSNARQANTRQTILPKPEGLKKAAIEKKREKIVSPADRQEKQEKTAAHNSRYSPTSGPESPDALDKQAALVEPVFDAAYLNNPAPAYPAAARKRGIQGKTMLEVEVSSQGQPRAIHVINSSGSNVLDEAALDAVRRWRFIPAKRMGAVVEAKVIVPIQFKLN